MPTPPGTLTVVATPLGNRGDLSPRAARELLDQGMSARDAARELAAESGRPRREIYRLTCHLSGAGS